MIFLSNPTDTVKYRLLRTGHLIGNQEETVEFNDTLSTSMDDFSENTQDLEIPDELPMMAVRDVVVFNYMIIPLFVGRPASIEAVNEAVNGNKLLMLVTQKDATRDDPEPEDIYPSFVEWIRPLIDPTMGV